jgi:hypothetical protein
MNTRHLLQLRSEGCLLLFYSHSLTQYHPHTDSYAGQVCVIPEADPPLGLKVLKFTDGLLPPHGG